MSAPPGANGLSGSASGADCGRVGVASGSGGRMTAATVGVVTRATTSTCSGADIEVVAGPAAVDGPPFQVGNVQVQQPHGAMTPWPGHQPYPPYGYGWPAPAPAKVVHNHITISGADNTLILGDDAKKSPSSGAKTAETLQASFDRLRQQVEEDAKRRDEAITNTIKREGNRTRSTLQVIRETWAIHAEFVGQMERLVQLHAGLDLSDEARENVQEMDALIRAYRNRLNELDDADAGQD